MFNEKSITPGLAELGYLRLKKLTYKASWSSTDVEHFLFFARWGGGKYFTGDFGVRNPSAERFAIECLKSFAGPIFQDARFDPRYGCSMRFSLGRLAAWPSRSSLVISEMSEVALADRVTCDIRDFLFPVVRSVVSAADLFSFLMKDEESSRWFRASGAIRAAKIVYLGRRLGMQTSELEAVLQPYLKNMVSSIGRSSMGDWQSPSAFLEKVLRYSN